MADEQAISQLQERVAFLEGLVMSLVAKNQPSADSTTIQANTDWANNVQAAPTITEETSEEQVPHLMRLPAELRADILERVLQPVFAADPYGLTPPLPLPVTIYTSKTRLPAVLQVNQVMRIEGMKLYLNMARTKIAELETANKSLYQAYENLKTQLERTTGIWGVGGAGPLNGNLQAMSNDIIRNFTAMTDLDASCKALQEGSFKHKKALPPRWIIRAR